MNTMMNRIKFDIQTCSSSIYEPKTLKNNIIKLHKCYVQKADARLPKQEHVQKMTNSSPGGVSQAIDAKTEQV